MSKIQLKNELKKLAEQIRKSKIECKEYQKNNGGSDGGRFFVTYKLQSEFRLKHIAYCIMRGRKYEEIESNCSRAGEPNFDRIKEIINEHTTAEAVENVRACA
jgi:hypothetical protein